MSTDCCLENAVAESFFRLLRKERTKRRTYPDRLTAHADIHNYNEVPCNRQSKLNYNDMLSSVEYEKKYFIKPDDVWETRDDLVLV